VSYRVEFHATADAQLPGLPPDAFTALVDALVKIARDPRDSLATAEPDYRQVVFGGYGLCSFYVDESARTVRVFDVIWTG
jgi:hypothetical protein